MARLPLLIALVAAIAAPAVAQLPNLRVGLPQDVDSNKRLDVQAGYSLKVRSRVITAGLVDECDWLHSDTVVVGAHEP